MDINPPSRFWSGVGKVALLITIAGGGVGLYRNCAPQSGHSMAAAPTNTAGPVLTATLDYFDFDSPPNISSQIQKFRNLSKRESAEKFIETKSELLHDFVLGLSPRLDDLLNSVVDSRIRHFNWLDGAQKRDPESARQFKEALDRSMSVMLADYAESAFESEFLYSTPSFDSYVILNMRNEGERQASGVELQLPYKDIAVVEEGGEKPIVRVFDQKITLGTMLPRAERKLRLWTSARVTAYSFDFDKWRIAHVDGVGKITWLKKQ